MSTFWRVDPPLAPLPCAGSDSASFDGSGLRSALAEAQLLRISSTHPLQPLLVDPLLAALVYTGSAPSLDPPLRPTLEPPHAPSLGLIPAPPSLDPPEMTADDSNSLIEGEKRGSCLIKL